MLKPPTAAGVEVQQDEKGAVYQVTDRKGNELKEGEDYEFIDDDEDGLPVESFTGIITPVPSKR
jgi:hypothetical protein